MLSPVRGRDVLISMGLHRSMDENKLQCADRIADALRELQEA